VDTNSAKVSPIDRNALDAWRQGLTEHPTPGAGLGRVSQQDGGVGSGEFGKAHLLLLAKDVRSARMQQLFGECDETGGIVHQDLLRAGSLRAVYGGPNLARHQRAGFIVEEGGLAARMYLVAMHDTGGARKKRDYDDFHAIIPWRMWWKRGLPVRKSPTGRVSGSVRALLLP
jgi:hypothetical protein